MTLTTPHLPAHRLARWVSAVVDGRHDWGALRTVSDRRGTVWIRLAVYPPAITSARRRVLRLWRAWPVVGVALLLPTLVVGHLVGSVGAAALVAATLYLVTAVAVARAASPERHDVAEWHAAGDRPTGELTSLVATLRTAERAHDRGMLTDAEYTQVRASVHHAVRARMPR